MNIDGIWTGEIYGPYGWQNNGVYILQDGLMTGGNDRHFSTGRFSLSDGGFRAKVEGHYYGPPRTVFGQNRETFQIEMKGELADGVIDAEIAGSDNPLLNVLCRLTRRMDLPQHEAHPGTAD